MAEYAPCQHTGFPRPNTARVAFFGPQDLPQGGPNQLRGCFASSPPPAADCRPVYRCDGKFSACSAPRGGEFSNLPCPAPRGGEFFNLPCPAPRGGKFSACRAPPWRRVFNLPCPAPRGGEFLNLPCPRVGAALTPSRIQPLRRDGKASVARRFRLATRSSVARTTSRTSSSSPPASPIPAPPWWRGLQACRVPPTPWRRVF